MTLSAADGYSFGDVGNDSLADTSSTESDSYGVSDWLWSSESLTDSGDLPDGTYGSGAYMTDVDDLGSYSLTADGTDSVSGGHDLSTMNDDIGVSSSVGGSFSFSAPVAYGYIDQFGDGFFAGTIYGFEESGGPSSSAESYAGVSIDYGLYYPGPFSWSSAQGNDTHLVGEVTPMTPSYFPGPVWANASAGSPLSMIEEDQLPDGVVGVTSESGTLYLSGPRVKDDFTAGGGTSSSSGGPNSYRVPDSAPVFLTGSALDLGVATPAFLPYGTPFGVVPSINAATPSGLPDQEATAVSNMAQDQGKPDGVSHDAAPSPTDTLIALAAAGRDPTDITLPTQGTAPTIPIPTPMATPAPTPTSTLSSPTSPSTTSNGATTSWSSADSTSAAVSSASTASGSSHVSTSAATSDASASSLSYSSSASTGATPASGNSAATSETADVEEGDGGSSGSHLVPEQAGGSGGGGFLNWLWSFLPGSNERPPAAPPEQHISPEELSATLDRMQAARQQVNAGSMPGRSGETMSQRMGNVYQTLAIDFPIYAGAILLDEAAAILIGNAGEFLAFQIAAKARGFLVKLAKKEGKLVLNVVTAEGKDVEKAAFSDFVSDWNEAYRARGRPSGPNASLNLPGRVQSRINLSNQGWDHVVKRHFSGKPNASQFTVTQAELRGVLQSKDVVTTPITRTLQSTEGTLYVREVDLGRQIGLDKFNNMNPTNIVSIVTDKFGNLITTTPGIIK